MSRFRDKASEIKEAGIKERGNFTPNGVPLRLYNWWLDNSPSDKASAIKRGSRKENFCHFWRVVLIWTPLLWSFIHVAEFFTSKAGMIGAGVVLGTALIYAITTVGSWFSILTVLGAAVGIAAGLLSGLLLIAWLNDKYDWFGPAALGVFLVGFAVFMLSIGFVELGPIFGAYLVAGLAIGAVAIFAGWKTADWVAGKRAVEEAERDAAWDLYIEGKGPNPFAKSVHVPSKWELKVHAFFRGVGDFLILIAQVVRVKKWGICPLVEVDNKTSDKIDYESGWETA